MEIDYLPIKELKVITSKKLSELKENTDRQLNKIRKMHDKNMHQQKSRNFGKKEPNKNFRVEEYNH